MSFRVRVGKPMWTLAIGRRSVTSVDDGVVPELADHVARRMRELRMNPTAFARRSGLSRQQLGDVRAGRRKNYQAVTIYGVADSLGWEPDWYERILDGKAPRVANADQAISDDLPERVNRLEEGQAEIRAGQERLARRVDELAAQVLRLPQGRSGGAARGGGGRR